MSGTAPAAGAKLDSLQVMRGIASLFVVLYHSGTIYAMQTGQLLWGNAFRAGFAGVDVFFVLSGVVIAWIHGADIGRPAHATRFVLKRAVRLLPVYWVVVAFKFAKDPAATTASSVLLALLLVPTQPPFVSVAWTLSFELYFYALFCLCIVLPRRLIALPVLAMALPVLLAALTGHGDPADRSVMTAAWRFVSDPHLLEFIFGMFIAWALRRHAAPRPALAGMLAAAGALAFVISAGIGTHLVNQMASSLDLHAYQLAELQTNAVLESPVLCFGLPAALVIYGLLALELRGRLRLPLRRPLVALGDISYSLYLLHGFVINTLLGLAAFRAVAVHSPVVLAAAWLVALLLSAASNHAIEKPALRYGQRLTQSRRPDAAGQTRLQ